jgi:hypothetical protein
LGNAPRHALDRGIWSACLSGDKRQASYKCEDER